MSLKLKLILGVLVLGAVFLGYRTAYIVLSPGNTSRSELPQSLTAQLVGADIPDDIDHDGLNDDDETEYKTDYHDADSDDDGYLDGEEVLSGYDPMRATDDQLHGLKSLTEFFAGNLIGGIISGDLSPSLRGTDGYELKRKQLS